MKLEKKSCATVKLGDIFKITSGGTPEKSKMEYYKNGIIQWVRTGDLKDKYITSVDSLITEEAINNSSAKIFPVDTVLVAMYGATIGACSILAIEAATNQACAAFLPNKEVNSSYLYYFLCSKKSEFVRRSVGGAQPNISGTILKGISIPLPSLEVQKKIAQTLDVAAELIALCKQQMAELDNLIKSTFYDMFGDPVTNEKGWELKKLPQIVAKSKNSLKRGPFGGSLKKEIFVDSGYLVYEQNHALNNDYSFKRYFINQKTFDELKDFEVKTGDILISCSGVYLGKLSIVPIGALPGIINQALLKITLDNDEMNQVFFVNVFSNPAFKKAYINSNRGSGIPNLPPMSVIKNIDFITPPLPLQNKFAEIVTKIEEQKVLVQKAIDESQYLFDSLMSKYFE